MTKKIDKQHLQLFMYLLLGELPANRIETLVQWAEVCPTDQYNNQYLKDYAKSIVERLI